MRCPTPRVLAPLRARARPKSLAPLAQGRASEHNL
jgi:hypothetical protein